MAKDLDKINEQELMREMGLTEDGIQQRKDFLEFNKDDEARLVGIDSIAREYADQVIESFYKHMLTFEPLEFFKDPKTLGHIKQLQKEYFQRLTQGNYDNTYIENRLKIGSVNENIGLTIKSYLGSYNFYLQTVAKRLFEEYKKQPEKFLEIFLSLMKLVILDIGLATDTYIFKREITIKIQQEAIRELSTPVLQVRNGLLILPMIGMMNTQRARQLTEQLLHTIRANRAKVVVVDITGVPTIDTAIANHIVQTVDAARLLGASVIVTGISPEIAQTLVTLGLDLSTMNTVGDLQGGIEQAEELLGYKVIKISDTVDEEN
jgi:rsbT co-antagonist protein RsbR